MRANRPWIRVGATRGKQRGVAAVEFAIVSILFFLFLFGIIEFARAMYICNTLQEVTRRAAALAANTDFSSGVAMQHVREQAVFRSAPGVLAFANPITDSHVRIDYLSIQKGATGMAMVPIPAGSMPGSPAANYVNCLKDAYGSDCIRLVRVRVCVPDAGATCTPVGYKSMVSLVALPLTLPDSTTIVNAETLGMPEGTPVCGC